MSAKSPNPRKQNKKSQSTHSKPCPPPTQFVSASSLLHGVQTVSFTKASRLEPLNSPKETSSVIAGSRPISFKSKRSTSFGFGQKQALPPSILRNARDLPGANAYKIPSLFEGQKGKGRTFGMPRECFEKTYVPGVDQMPLGVAMELPGPGQYNVQRKLKGGFSLVGKGKAFNKVCDDDGPISIYHPKLAFVEPARFKSIGFGFGKRGNFTARKDEGPGPGTYDFLGHFDKYSKKNKQFYR